MMWFARIALRCALVLTLPGSGVAFAQANPDPTRPPKDLLQSQPRGLEPVGGAPHRDADTALQSLIIGPSKRYAIIEGRVVGVGDWVDDARVVAVTSTHVVLRSERGVQTLKLFPDIEMRPSKPVSRERSKESATPKRSIRLGDFEGNVAKGRK